MPPRPRINHRKVIWMARTGYAPCAIASRLSCSEKQVRRILSQHRCTALGNKKDFTGEKSLWHMYRKVFQEPEAFVALRFGVSRQAIHQHFKTTHHKQEVTA